MKSSVAFLRQHVLPAVVCFGVALLLGRMEFFQRLENETLDQRTKLRAFLRPTVPDANLALIGIDETSLHDYGQWPWPRETHGVFLQLVGLVRPSVVAWDILFTEANEQDSEIVKGARIGGAAVIFGAKRAAEEEGVKPGDEAAKTGRLRPLTRIEGDRAKIASDEAMNLPAGELAQVAEIGFVDVPPDDDAVRRRAPLIVRIGDQVYPTLSLCSLMEFWHATPENVTVRLGEAVIIDAPLAKRRIPIDETGAYWINYRHALGGFANYGYSATVQALYNRFVKKEPGPIPQLTGRILLVGQVADGLTDFGATPFSPLTPLVLVHANVVENVLQQDYVHRLPDYFFWLGAFVLGVAGMARFSTRKLHEQAVFSVGIPVAYTMVTTVAWVNGSWLLPLVGPLGGFALLQIFMIGRRVLTEQRAKEQIKGMFGTYVSPQLVTRMIESGEMPQLGGHDAEITAYFSDIQGFSTFSEKLKSGPLVELMNEYLTACTDIVQGEGGTLDKYIGDAVVAMFGAPIAMEDHAFRACVASQRVQLKLAELREKWKGEGAKWPEIVWRMRTRIGLNTGECTIGNMGSRTRFNYTMMGDDVNLAARMESGAKTWGVYTMCTEATKLACEKYGGDRVVFRPLGRIVVKGRSAAVPIHEIVGLRENVTLSAREGIGVFAEALGKYYARDWDGARALLARSRDLESNVPGKNPGVTSNPSLVYLDIIARYKQEPPPENWDGVTVMHEK
jgi:adenylate cyclase